MLEKRLEEMTLARGLDSKFKCPGPAQYLTLKSDFAANGGNRDVKKPKYSFSKSPKFRLDREKKPGPGEYNSHIVINQSSVKRSRRAVINPPVTLFASTKQFIERKKETIS